MLHSARGTNSRLGRSNRNEKVPKLMPKNDDLLMVLRSVHSGKTNGILPQNWPEYDCASFDKVEDSMVKFACNVFSKSHDVY